ncbi:hypothetical protein [Rhodopila globiformis]|uniref:Uncharacterized protein n=1 Tax=Rhodopila globiformis TaxID=1071 RepID=A0A2S6NP47_RHOGL|nr:hypothetical protein [Rhodopila globiformis]PPQ40144.1 hypothetical protein CCS01_00760 [Rhodopila globiformis]
MTGSAIDRLAVTPAQPQVPRPSDAPQPDSPARVADRAGDSAVPAIRPCLAVAAAQVREP